MSVPERKNHSVSLSALGLVLALIATASTASAVSMNEVPEAMADTLGISTYAAELLMTMAVLLGITLALALSGAPMPAYVAIDVVIIIFFIAIGWLDYWVIVVVILLAIGAFAVGASKTLFPGGG